MKKNLKPVILLLTIISSVFLFACGKTNVSDGANVPSEIVGKWRIDTGKEHIFIFNSDGTIELQTNLGNAYGTYEVDGNTLTYTMTMPNNKTKTSTITFECDGDSLVINRDGHIATYLKEK